ncbi:DNA primase [Lichenicoccus roseus]|uniref:DNA primase n=1 Tax=Lichenicoccus roseus TaxID=2683649 RepID=A0A5R9J8S6_9PROT|nr:DNA primase [Lichenicoccus roseus]TLU73982.1 DNA primase [Lichenicoccus roseus]
MAFDPAFLDELRARTPIAAVIGRRARLTRSGRNWKACCPFHGEKTPSFYVYDDHFHCFGCGAHGDVISFAMQSGGQSFLETVNALAAEAGLEVPRQTEAARGAAARARTLAEALEAAQRSFVRRLSTPEGREGLAYLRKRGLGEATIAAFGLGWSGDGRGNLAAQLHEQGIEASLMAEAGLMRLDEAGRPKGELFFNRITFPIRDRRGSLVSFGGRILGDGQPKYLNGPETALFSKRRTLFALDRAQEALRAVSPSGKAAAPEPLVVVEGYMDVIALHQAGIRGAVAPLGTALTIEQLEALWRASPQPVLCFDGDAAGRRAAIKAAETALPLLDMERTLRFCRLPDGEDPDSLMRAQGAGTMRAVLAAARPIGDVLFELLSEGVHDPGPEQRAALHARLVDAAGRIGNKTLAAEYRRTLLDRFFETFRRRRTDQNGSAGGRGSGQGGASPAGLGRMSGGRPGPGAGAAGMVAIRRPVDGSGVRAERSRILTAILLRHPELLHDVEEAYCGLELPDGLRQVREHVIAWASTIGGDDDAPGPGVGAPALDSQALIDHLTLAGLSTQLDAVLGRQPLPLAEQVDAGDMPAEVEARWWHYFGLLNFERLEQEMQAALRQWVERNDEPSHRRLRALSEACSALRVGEQADEDS